MDVPSPLRPPSSWPPLDFPSRNKSESALEKIPAIGWLIGSWRERLRWSAYVAEVLVPIEQQLIDQLVARPPYEFWSSSSPHARMADILERAVSREKGLAAVTVHPDDPIEFLLWGASDDLSPLRFALGLRNECGIELSTQDIQSFCAIHMTVAEVFEFCLTKNGSVDPQTSTAVRIEE